MNAKINRANTLLFLVAALAGSLANSSPALAMGAATYAMSPVAEHYLQSESLRVKGIGQAASAAGQKTEPAAVSENNGLCPFSPQQASCLKAITAQTLIGLGR